MPNITDTLAELMKFYKVEVNEDDNQHAYVKVANPTPSVTSAPKVANAQNNKVNQKVSIDSDEEEIDLGNFESM